MIRAGLFLAPLLLAGCGEQASTLVAPPQLAVANAAHGSGRSSPITHVVIVIQENRSFDNLFQGYPGADTQPYGYSGAQKIKLRKVSLAAKYSIDHNLSDFVSAYDGGAMDGFDRESIGGPHPKHPAYAYVPPGETKAYFEMAHDYVLADHMFTSHLDASFVSHQYAIAAQAQGAVDLPTGDWGCEGEHADFVSTLNADRSIGPHEVPCFDYRTLGDELDAAALTWRFYAADKTDIWSAYQAVRHVYDGPDWNDVIAPNTQFMSDVQAGSLANVTWITPTCLTSDHPGCGSKLGPAWVSDIVDTVGASPFWNSTAIFVMWDEWGGWYDHVPPPYVDYDGLGIRVPLLVISPYAKQGYVSHVQYEHGSILRFVEDQFGLGRLAASDARANSPEADCFTFARAPRAFTPIAPALVKRERGAFFGDRSALDED